MLLRTKPLANSKNAKSALDISPTRNTQLPAEKAEDKRPSLVN